MHKQNRRTERNRTLVQTLFGLILALALIVPLAVLPGGAAATSPPAGAITAPPAADVVLTGVTGVTEGWWAAAQANILADMNAGPHGLPDAANWDHLGESADDAFGLTIAGAGDVDGDGYADVIVGAPYYPGFSSKGKAYVFLGSELGLVDTAAWSQAGDQNGDLFGYSVAGAGDVNGDGYADVIVGSYGYNNSQDDEVGQALVFLGSENGLDLSPLTPFQGDDDGGSFGYSVAGAGDVNGDGYADIVVGAKDHSGSTGRVYLYHGGPSGPDQFADRTLTGEGLQHLFGYSVAGVGDIDGDGFHDIAIGAIGYDRPGASQAGAAYLYRGSSSGVEEAWSWKQSMGEKDEWYGSSVAGAGDVDGDGYADIVVGAKQFGGSSAKRGAAYLYLGDRNGLNEIYAWAQTGENDGDLFGTAVTGAGDVNGDGYADVMVGAPGYGTDKGKVYVYLGSPDDLDNSPSWTPEGESNSDDYGTWVAGAGDVNGDGFADVLVGAPGRESDKGKAYAYHGGADIPSLTEDWDEEGVTSGDKFGWSVASAGDVNGDGYADVLVGAYGVNASKGRVYAYYGGQDGLPDFSDWDADGEKAASWFGWSLASAGDVNGDGHGDVIVGAYGYKNAQDETVGRVYVYHGGPGGLGEGPTWKRTGEANSDYFGRSVAGAGDVNGDGYADVIVGADGHSASKGKVYAYHGSAQGLSLTANQTHTGAANYDYFGYSVAGAGDTNGDGYGDIVVGAYGAPYAGTGKHRGTVYVYAGTANGLGPISIWTHQGEGEDDRFGWSVAGPGDVYGDGYHDVLVGAWKNASGRGEAYLFNSVAGALGSSPAWTAPGEYGDDNFGYSVAGAGDVNGDGRADLLIGAINRTDLTDKGYAVLYLGPPTNQVFPPIDWKAEGGANGDWFGISVAGAGDVDGDGYSDVLVGAPGAGGGNGGQAYAYFGNDGGGRLVHSMQVDKDDTLIQPWNLTTSPGSFQVWLRAWNPAGRSRVKLEVTACPAGKNWSGTGCRRVRSPDWVDVFQQGSKDGRVLVKTLVDSLDDGQLYHWRGRVLYAPYTVVRAGISPPPNPAHGPWRRFLGQAFDADVRTQPCTYYISVSPSTAALTGGPGSTVRYRLRLENEGNCANTVDGTVSGNTWTTNLPATIGPLDPGQEFKFEVRVQVPKGTAEGDSDTATVTLAPRKDSSAAVSSTLTTTAGSFRVYLPMVVR